MSVANHEGTRSERKSQPHPDDGVLSAERLEEETVDRNSRVLGHWAPLATEFEKEGDASSHPFGPLQLPRGLAVSDPEKAQALADDLEAQIQLVEDPSKTTFHEIRWGEAHTRMRPQVNGHEPVAHSAAAHEGTQGRQGYKPERYIERLPDSST